MKRTLAAILLALTLAGCPQRPREDANPAPSSSMTHTEAMVFGMMWQQQAPRQHAFSAVAATGSMAPILDSRSVLLLELPGTSPLNVNDIAVYRRKDGVHVVHRIKEIRPDGILFDGDNNQGSDGWVSPSAVEWRVAGILFSQRP